MLIVSINVVCGVRFCIFDCMVSIMVLFMKVVRILDRKNVLVVVVLLLVRLRMLGMNMVSFRMVIMVLMV